MTSVTTFFSSITSSYTNWLEALAILLAFWLAGFFFRRVLFFYLSRWSAKTENQIDDVIILKSRLHVIFWFFLLGIYFAGKVTPVGQTSLHVVNQVIFSLLVMSLTFLTANILAGIAQVYSEKISLSLPLTSLTENLIKLAIVVIGILVLLAHLGISITPLLTALGVGSLAVALALQDTLSNLFAGFYILANKQIRPGDYIKVDTGHEGFILDIGWRATRIKELSGNTIIIPNAKLGSAVVTNFSLPQKDMGITVPVGVAYDSDLEKVEKITTEVARQTITEVAGGVKEFEPFIRYNAFGDSCIQFNVILRVREFTDQYLLTHEFIKRLHKRYLTEGIDIPFPQQVVHLKKSE